MSAAILSLEERQMLLARFLARYTKRGFQTISHNATTAELYRPARFPQRFFKAQTLFIDIDSEGCIRVSKS